MRMAECLLPEHEKGGCKTMVRTQNKVEHGAEVEQNLPFHQKLFSFRYHRPFEVQQTIVPIIGFFLIIASLFFADMQIKAYIDTLNLQANQDLMSNLLDVDQVFIDNPDLRPYFFDGKKISPTDRNYNKVLAIADYEIDFFGSVLNEVSYSQSYASEKETRQSWDQYMHTSFKESPIMCQRLKYLAITGQYEPEFINKFKVDCPGDFRNK